MKMTPCPVHSLLILAALAGTVVSTQAALVATVTESGPDLLVTVEGSLDLSGATYFGTGLYDVGNFVDATTSSVNVVDVGDMDLHMYSPAGTVTGTLNLGGITAGNSGDNRFFMSTNEIYVTAGYLSGEPISFTTTIPGVSFASLGITPGEFRTVTRTLGVAGSDSFTITTAIPEPATLPLAALALGLACRSRRRHTA